MTQNNFIFLLGGADLEMLEIKTILDKYGQPYLDKNLQWGNASWSAYAEDFTKLENQQKTFVGIELSGKENRPKNSIDIDHHNENHENQSAIEQVIELLGIPEEWTRRRQLVAANDTGHINGMKALNASPEEIAEIRQQDRKAQGVTEMDEEKAQVSIEKYNTSVDGVRVIFSLTAHFSCIVDRLYGEFEKLLVFNHTTLNYYGNITELKDEFEKEIETGRAYYGGQLTAGYFGLAEGKWCWVDFESCILQIVSVVGNETNKAAENTTTIRQLLKSLPEKIYSHHIFLFPFKWRRNSQPGAYQLDEFDDLLKPDVTSHGNWKKQPFSCELKIDGELAITSGWDQFNELNYFYDHVRKMLYEMDESPGQQENQFMRHYEYELNDRNANYQILIREKEEENSSGSLKTKDTTALPELKATYSLSIDTIILNVYRTGTAVLSFHLRNHSYANEEDILKINLFGRRISVPFFGMQADSVYSGLPDHSHYCKDHDPLKLTKENEIPNAIWLGKPHLKRNQNNQFDQPFFEDFSAFRKAKNYRQSPFLIPQFIKGLFPEGFLAQRSEENGIKIDPVLDDRMHVISWYGNTDLVQSLKQHVHIDPLIEKEAIWDKIQQLKDRDLRQSYFYELSDWWHKYVYVDTGVLQTNRFERVANIRQQTYSRFVEWGTLYGVSRYSFVMLTRDFSSTPGFLIQHLQSMYYKMVELCLLQRGTILKFSDEAARLSQQVFDLDNGIKNKRKEVEIIRKINQLYRSYIFFVNRIYFREVTPQEQGIELYDLLQKTMRIPQEVNNLNTEICELNAFVKTINQENQTKEANNFTWMAALFLGPTFFAGVLGMNSVPTSWANDGTWSSFFFSFTVVGYLGLLTAIILLYFIRKQNP